jgi:hypothetical protein
LVEKIAKDKQEMELMLRSEIEKLRIENESLKRQINSSTPKRKVSEING